MGPTPLRAASVAATTAVLAALVTPTASSATVPTAPAPVRKPHYVALGDSSAAGPLIPPQTSLPCLRSGRNWPAVAAARLGAEITDVTCSGATTADLAGRQFGLVRPQLDALRADTDLVTLAVGANDIGLGIVVPSCVRLHPQAAGLSPTCKSVYTAGGRDRLAERITRTAPKIATALRQIHRRSPHARVYVVTYGTYYQPGGCWPKDPVWPVDADYVQNTFDRLHTMLAERAAAGDAGFVDIRTPSARHGVCAAKGEKWMEGLIPGSAAAPYHPNRTGMAHSGATVADAVGPVRSAGAPRSGAGQGDTTR
ncbi:SGNH/GDSL hydrolase family protein [Streptomyces sp. NPDC059788]|uniref:SGNH/GDSL hydrolase family protein n=1 Tax=Streptomyces sp. NPDC059788 TaxID=3346948 RepID=UPI0036595CD8